MLTLVDNPSIFFLVPMILLDPPVTSSKLDLTVFWADMIFGGRPCCFDVSLVLITLSNPLENVLDNVLLLGDGNLGLRQIGPCPRDCALAELATNERIHIMTTSTWPKNLHKLDMFFSHFLLLPPQDLMDLKYGWTQTLYIQFQVFWSISCTLWSNPLNIMLFMLVELSVSIMHSGNELNIAESSGGNYRETTGTTYLRQQHNVFSKPEHWLLLVFSASWSIWIVLLHRVFPPPKILQEKRYLSRIQRYLNRLQRHL